MVGNVSMAFQPPQWYTPQILIDEYLQEQGIAPKYIIKSEASGKNGVSHFYGIQTFLNYEIEGTEYNLSIQNDKIISFNHNFITDFEKIIAHREFILSPTEAFFKRYPEIQGEVDGLDFGQGEIIKKDIPEISDETILITKLWANNNGKYVAAYEVSMYQKDGKHWYNTKIDAKTGVLLTEIDWVSQCKFDGIHTEHSFHQCASPEFLTSTETYNTEAQYNVFALPVESPTHGDRSIVSKIEDETASPFGWHDVNGVSGAEYTITRGNNVYAYEDTAAVNSPGYSPDGGDNLIFDFDFDKNKSHHIFLDAAITNLFYVNNMMHDVWYHYGFDEISGNFQQNNYGRGGHQNDYVRAEAQDGSGTNNANFATPPDGNRPRMQMYLWGSNIGRNYLRIEYENGTAGNVNSVVASFGPRPTSDGVSGELIHIIDDNPGCVSITEDLEGKIALIERGGCTFVEKVLNAQNAGAVGVVVFNNIEGGPIVMGGQSNQITIPSVMISNANGIALINVLNQQKVTAFIWDNLVSNGDIIYDSDFDNGIIAHEFGHGISVRLTGGAMTSNCLNNEEQMGEGWSDFFALVMAHDHETNPDGTLPRGIGAYTRGQQANGGGIRPYRYSTNMAVSPYVYNNVKTLSIPHGVGSVWCAMLWDLYWALVEEYGFDEDIFTGKGGNNIAMQLVLDGMKYQPCRPGFIDGRDAILLADEIHNNGKNQELIWRVFARRGLGFDAKQGSPDSRLDNEQGFEMPPFLKEVVFEKSAPFEADGGEVDYTLRVHNYTSNPIRNTFIIDTLPDNTSYVEGSSNCDIVQLPGRRLRFNLNEVFEETTVECNYKLNYTTPSQAFAFFSDNISDNSDWEVVTALGSHQWQKSSVRKSKGNQSWFVPNQNFITDYQLVREFDLTRRSDNVIFSFHHFYNTDPNSDGGVVEIFVNDQWIDAGPYFLMNGYNSDLSGSSVASLRNRSAFSGRADDFERCIIDLSEFIGKKIKLRFRFLSDERGGNEGWYVDQMEMIQSNMLINKAGLRYDSDQKLNAFAITFVDGALNVEKIVNYNFAKVYPNPFSDLITIQSVGKLDYTILNVLGSEVANGNGMDETMVSLSHLPVGVYFVMVQSGQYSQVFKISKHTSN